MTTPRITVARSLSELRRLEGRWREIFDLDLSATIFQNFEWNYHAAAHFADRLQPYVVYAEHDSGLALLPTVICQSTHIEFLGEALFDYRQALRVGDESVEAAAWNELAKLGLGIQISALQSPVPGVPARLGPAFFVNSLTVEGITDAEFEAAHPKLRKARSRLEKLGFHITLQDGSRADLVGWIAGIKAEQKGLFGASLFREQARTELLCELAQASGSACQVYTLRSDKQVIAALVSFVDRGWWRFYNTAYDIRFRHHSPGMALLFEATRRSLAAGLRCDYLTGEQPYKQRLATGKTPLYRIELSAGEFRTALTAEAALGRVA